MLLHFPSVLPLHLPPSSPHPDRLPRRRSLGGGVHDARPTPLSTDNFNATHCSTRRDGPAHLVQPLLRCYFACTYAASRKCYRLGALHRGTNVTETCRHLMYKENPLHAKRQRNPALPEHCGQKLKRSFVDWVVLYSTSPPSSPGGSNTKGTSTRQVSTCSMSFL